MLSVTLRWFELGDFCLVCAIRARVSCRLHDCLSAHAPICRNGCGPRHDSLKFPFVKCWSDKTSTQERGDKTSFVHLILGWEVCAVVGGGRMAAPKGSKDEKLDDKAHENSSSCPRFP
jgi:hypothetical protein